jgi:hypothetical protein
MNSQVVIELVPPKGSQIPHHYSMSYDSGLQERKEIINYEDIATCLRVEPTQE